MIAVQARVVDSTHLELAQPIVAPTGGRIVVFVPDSTNGEDEHEAWARFAISNLASAYGEDKPEYTLDMVKGPNEEYGK
jgi:hypothetical protein